MKGQLLFVGKFFLIWLSFFFFQRLLFIIQFFSDFSSDFTELLMLPFYSFKLDLSGFGYLFSVIFLISLGSFFIKSERAFKILNTIIQIYFWVMLILTALMMSGEIVTYIEWRTKLSTKIFIHLKNPVEVFRTASGYYTFLYFLYFILQLLGGYLIYNKWFKKNSLQVHFLNLKQKVIAGISYFLIGTAVIIIGIRGGLQQIPVSATDGYFSDKQIVNDLSVNPVWNFIHTCYVYFKGDWSEYFRHLDPSVAETIKNEVYAEANKESESVQVLSSDKPNVILVILEGWSAQLIEPLGGEPEITKNFNKLSEEGLLFTQVYANSGTSETGHSSILSGYPTISGISISTESAKCRQLPSLNQSFEANGYNSFYAFGGSLSYGNIGGYLIDVGFDRVVDEKDLDLLPEGKLGIHDEAMFPYFLGEIKKAKTPFFYTLFTQSTHAPYDMPAETVKGYEDDDYVKSMVYADKHLGLFAEELEKLPDFENTLVVFIADHGRTNFNNQDTYSEKYFHIPLLFWGGALKKDWISKKNNKIGTQADLAKTLLNQLNFDISPYYWSKDILNSSVKGWGICTSTLSYGWKDENGYTVYHMIDKKLIHSPYKETAEVNKALEKCRAVLESMYREFEEL